MMKLIQYVAVVCATAFLGFGCGVVDNLIADPTEVKNLIDDNVLKVSQK